MEGQRYLHSLGVTSWQDAIVGAYSGMDDPGATYVKAAANGDLRSHVVGALWWERRLGVEQVADLVGRREALSGGRFQARAVKVMQDGVAENGTAAMLTPYLDAVGHETDNRGPLVRRGRRPARGGAPPSTRPASRCTCTRSATGRPARRWTRSRARHPSAGTTSRTSSSCTPTTSRASPALGVAANMQALWACEDEQMIDLTLPFLGAERSAWQYPFGDLHRAGARLVVGSDWPVSTPDPLQAIHVAVTRHGVRRAGRRRSCPSRRCRLEVAFAAYTSGSAWINHRDEVDGAGVLEPGCRRRPRRARPRPVRGTPGGDRRHPSGVHLDRRRGRPPEVSPAPEEDPPNWVLRPTLARPADQWCLLRSRGRDEGGCFGMILRTLVCSGPWWASSSRRVVRSRLRGRWPCW